MIGKIIFLACLALAQAKPNLAERNANDQCPPNLPHYLLPHEWDCTKFYYCEYGQKWESATSCAPGTQFSYQLQVCIHPVLANCTLPNVPPPSSTEPAIIETTTTNTEAPTTTEEPTTTTTTTQAPTTTEEPTTTTHGATLWKLRS